jgi:3-keto-disaccharide hydrolase
MNRFLIALLFVLCFVRFGGAADAKNDLQPIFNGKDLTGWKPSSDPKAWKVVDGVLVGENDESKKGSMLYTEKSYGDLIVEADVRWNGEIDSGIMVRKPEMQLQIGVSRSLKKDMTGSFYCHGGYPEPGQAKGAQKLIKEGDWNTMRLQAIGPKYTVWLNGEKVVEYEDPASPKPGPIGLQIHGGLKMKVEFRNIKAKALDAVAQK